MKVTVHERVPENLVLKLRQRLNLQMDEYNWTWYLDTVCYQIPAQCFTNLSEVYRDFSLTQYKIHRK
jgi:hypothetical protein